MLLRVADVAQVYLILYLICHQPQVLFWNLRTSTTVAVSARRCTSQVLQLIGAWVNDVLS